MFTFLDNHQQETIRMHQQVSDVHPNLTLQDLYQDEATWEKALITAVQNVEGELFYPQFRLNWFKVNRDNSCSKPMAICGKTDDSYDRANCELRGNQCVPRPIQGDNHFYYLSAHGNLQPEPIKLKQDSKTIFVTIVADGIEQDISTDKILTNTTEEDWQRLLVDNDVLHMDKLILEGNDTEMHQANVAVYRPGDSMADIALSFWGEVAGSHKSKTDYFYTGFFSFAKLQKKTMLTSKDSPVLRDKYIAIWYLQTSAKKYSSEFMPLRKVFNHFILHPKMLSKQFRTGYSSRYDLVNSCDLAKKSCMAPPHTNDTCKSHGLCACYMLHTAGLHKQPF